MGEQQRREGERYDVRSSPFVELTTPFTLWEGVKMAVLLPTVPIRLLICFWAIVGVAVVNSIAIAGYTRTLETQPLPRWRRRLVELSSETCCAVVLRVVGFTPRVVGLEHYEEGRKMGAIGCFNHVSKFDAFVVVWFACVAGVTFNFSKHLPILGYGVRALQNLYVNPERPPLDADGNPKPRPSMTQLIRERAANRALPMLSVAPEGTLSNGRCLLQFKTGAFAAGAPVVPFLLRWSLGPAVNPAWTICHEGFQLLRMMCQPPGALRVTVEVLPPYVPSAAERADAALYAANVRRLMADKLGVPLVEQDRRHFLALTNAGVSVSLDGRRVTAPPGVLDEHDTLDLAPYMPGVFVKPQRKKAL